MAFDVSSVFGGFGSSLINIGLPLILVLFLAVLVIILYTSGALTRYPQKAILRIPRAGGGHKVVTKPARSVKGGKTEIKFGWFDKLSVSECPQELVQEGDIIEGIMYSKEEVTWIKNIEINEAEMKFKAAVPENAQLTFAVSYDSAFQRTHKAKQWVQFVPYIALIVAAVILFGGMYVMGNMQKEGMNAYAGSIDHFSRMMENSTTVIYKTQSGSGGIASGFPNVPSDVPPG